MEKFCVIVDGYSTGKYLSKILCQKGYECIHVQSTPHPLAFTKNDFSKDDYHLCLTYHENFIDIVEILSQYPLSFIVAGSEPGVDLAAKLSYHFQLFPNGQEIGQTCRDKFKMGNALEKSGLSSIKQHKVDDPLEAVLWARKNRIWPCAVKPLDSAGGDGFYLCESEKDVIHAVESVLSSKTLFEKKNEAALVQEFLIGHEYVVNTVSYHSQHYVDSFMKYKKRKIDGKIVYEYSTFVSPDEVPEKDKLVSYVFKCLDALGVKNGPAHNEIMMTSQGPVLIETGARLMGASYPPGLLKECLGHSQVELTSLLYTDQKAFSSAIKKPYHLRKHLMLVHLINPSDGIIERVAFLDQIHKLKSFYCSRLYFSPGDYLKKTVDLASCPADIILVHPKKEVIEQDLIKIRKWEEMGILIMKEREPALT